MFDPRVIAAGRRQADENRCPGARVHRGVRSVVWCARDVDNGRGSTCSA